MNPGIHDVPIKFHRSTPILPVRDLAAALRYFTEALGFTEDWKDSGVFASVSREEANLYLCQGDQGHAPTWAWIGVGDVRALFDEFSRSHARIRHPPTNYPWALEMQVEDLDGNVMRFGSDPEKERPPGPWLDMHGRSWPPRGR